MLNDEIIIEIHWSNNPIPINQIIDDADCIIEIPFGVFTPYPSSAVQSVNGKTGAVILNHVDVGADPTGAADQVKSQLENNIAQVLTLAQTNELKIGTKADQIDFEAAQIQVENNRLAILTKADIQALAMLAQLVGTKADQAYVNQQIAELVGSAPEALNTIYELAAALQNEQSLVETLNQSVANRVRFDIATQALTEIQKLNARTNIDAEKVGTAQQLISQITAQSLGAATAAQGAKADTAIQSSDLAPVAMTGLFSSLSSQNKIFDVIFNSYVIGSNTAISASDSLGQMLAKLQAQISNFNGGSSGFDWIPASTIQGFSLHGQVSQAPIQLKLAKKDGLLWLSGSLSVSGQVLTTSKIFSLINANYKIERFASPSVDIVVASINVIEMGYNFGTNPSMNPRVGSVYMTSNELYFKMPFNTPNDGSMIFFSPTPIGRLI